MLVKCLDFSGNQTKLETRLEIRLETMELKIKYKCSGSTLSRIELTGMLNFCLLLALLTIHS